MLFQPTRPARGETAGSAQKDASVIFQPTRPARGETVAQTADQLFLWISTHSPRAGRDEYFTKHCHGIDQFQPTRPARGETAKTHKQGYALL